MINEDRMTQIIHPMFHVGLTEPKDPLEIPEVYKLIQEGIKRQEDNTRQKNYHKAIDKYQQLAFVKQAYFNTMEGKEPFSDSKTMLENFSNNVSSKPPYVFLTINPKPGIHYPYLHGLMEKYNKKKYIEEITWVYEVRNEKHEGLHCHALIRYKGRPANFQRGTKNMFKNVCDINNWHCLNIQYVNEENLNSKIEYMKGNKCDKKKNHVKFTNQWRDKEKISVMLGSPLSCWGYSNIEMLDN